MKKQKISLLQKTSFSKSVFTILISRVKKNTDASRNHKGTYYLPEVAKVYTMF